MGICPAGHRSAADDYCDVCGLPVTPGGGPTPAAQEPPAPGPTVCPHCGTANVPDALFCEACGYDFTTGTPPRSAASPEPADEPPPVSRPSAALAATSAKQPPATMTDPAADAASDESSAASAAGPDGGPSTPGTHPPAGAGPWPPDGTPTGGDHSADLQPTNAPDQPSSAVGGPATKPTPAAAEALAPPQGPLMPQERAVQPSAPTNASREQPALADWVAEIWIDPDWYATQGSPDPLPSPGLPEIIPLQTRTALIGRTSVSRNIHPQIAIDLDTGISRRHAQVTTDGTRWWIEDLESANGTFVGDASGSLPTTPIGRGRVEFAPDQRIYVGAWTRLVIRRATEDEVQAYGA